MKPGTQRIPSLDGLRAFSILLVLVGHGSATFPPTWHLPDWFASIIENAELGVYVFFVISGFLITRLLMAERSKTGTISIKNFYVRRTFRIWPAFYAFWIATVLLAVVGVIKLHIGEALAAAFYYWNYYPAGQTWFLGHTWSLAVEEQFYFFWPLTLRLLGNRSARVFAAGVILVSPLIRLGTYVIFPHVHGHIPIMLHTRMDSLMFGSLAALLYDEPFFQRFLQNCYRYKLPAFAAVFAFLISPQLTRVWKGSYALSIGWSLEGLCIALILLWSIQQPSSVVGKLLNWGPVVHIGLISYSLYLWNQWFLTPLNHTVTGMFPLNALCVWAAAECSYRLVEQPFLRLRSRIADRQAAKTTLATAAA